MHWSENPSSTPKKRQLFCDNRSLLFPSFRVCDKFCTQAKKNSLGCCSIVVCIIVIPSRLLCIVCGAYFSSFFLFFVLFSTLLVLPNSISVFGVYEQSCVCDKHKQTFLQIECVYDRRNGGFNDDGLRTLFWINIYQLVFWLAKDNKQIEGKRATTRNGATFLSVFIFALRRRQVSLGERWLRQ